MKHTSRSHIVVLLSGISHCSRETARGATDYIAAHADLDLDLRFLHDCSEHSLRRALQNANGILTMACKKTIAHVNAAPCVFMLAPSSLVVTPSVNIDDKAVGRLAAEHLLSRGYRQFATIFHSSDWFESARRQGFEQVVTAAGLSVHHHEVPVSHMKVFDAVCRCDLQPILTAQPFPYGLFACDYTACYAINTARLLGIAIPEQIGIVATDDDPLWYTEAKVSLSSVQPPFFEVGQVAAQTLHDLMRGKRVTPSQMLVPIRVVERASTNAFMIDDPIVARALRYIEDNRGRNLRVTEVTKAISGNQYTLEKHFVRALDMTIMDYIIRRRIEYAKELLREGKLNVDEVANACGFYRSDYFGMMFKRLTGVTPGHFRPK